MEKSKKIKRVFRAPIVAVLGHVDHGKTTLLDTIRKTNVASGEHGGITQHIGAYQVEYRGKGKGVAGRPITFIDTPGHEAFAKMRRRGATVADIAILVVAADDSVKPQTKESILQIKEAGIPMIVAANKVDLPAANLERVTQDLAKVGVQVEGFGGDIPIVPISAKSGTGVVDLLEMILLIAELKGLPDESNEPLAAIVIETKVEKGRGMVASLVVKRGVLRPGESLFDGQSAVGKVRAIFDEAGKAVSTASSGKPVEVIGFTKLPFIGSTLTHVSTIGSPQAPSVSEQRDGAILPDYLKPLSEVEQKLTIILKADTAGSIEAILASFSDRITVVHAAVGDITENDILTAKSTKAFVIGFQVKVAPGAEKLAQTEKVVYRTYQIIYELLDELADVVAGLKEVTSGERELGAGVIVTEFPYEQMRIAGTKIVSGRLARGDSIKIMRGDDVVARAKIKSIRQGKQDVTKVEGGSECGVLFDRTVDFQPKDGIIAVTQV